MTRSRQFSFVQWASLNKGDSDSFFGPVASMKQLELLFLQRGRHSDGLMQDFSTKLNSLSFLALPALLDS